MWRVHPRAANGLEDVFHVSSLLDSPDVLLRLKIRDRDTDSRDSSRPQARRPPGKTDENGG